MPRLSETKRSITEEYVLTEQQRTFARFLAEGKDVKTAGRLAGYSNSGTMWALPRNPVVMNYVKKLQRTNERKSDMSRKRVMDGFLEAIEQAKIMSEPMTQIAGWREIAKMCGYFAPEVKKLDINVTSQRVLSTLETLSDHDLLEMIEKDAEMIEGEARLLLEHQDGRGSDRPERETTAGAGEQSISTS